MVGQETTHTIYHPNIYIVALWMWESVCQKSQGGEQGEEGNWKEYVRAESVGNGERWGKKMEWVSKVRAMVDVWARLYFNAYELIYPFIYWGTYFVLLMCSTNGSSTMVSTLRWVGIITPVGLCLNSGVVRQCRGDHYTRGLVSKQWSC